MKRLIKNRTTEKNLLNKNLIKQANNELDELLNKIEQSINRLNDSYYLFIEDLNDLFKSFPEEYEEINKVVKLPTKEDVEDIVDLKNNFDSIKNRFNNDLYLEQINKQ